MSSCICSMFPRTVSLKFVSNIWDLQCWSAKVMTILRAQCEEFLQVCAFQVHIEHFVESGIERLVAATVRCIFFVDDQIVLSHLFQNSLYISFVDSATVCTLNVLVPYFRISKYIVFFILRLFRYRIECGPSMSDHLFVCGRIVIIDGGQWVGEQSESWK